MPRLSVSLSEADFEVLRCAALGEGRSLSGMAAYLIRRALTELEQNAEAVRLGLVRGSDEEFMPRIPGALTERATVPNPGVGAVESVLSSAPRSVSASRVVVGDRLDEPLGGPSAFRPDPKPGKSGRKL